MNFHRLKIKKSRENSTLIQTALNKEEKNKDIKLARLRYIQSNILEKKNLKLELENIQKANKYLPQRSYSRIIERLNYIADTIRKKGNTESKLKEQIQNSNKLERLLGDIVFYQNITNESAYILPIAEFSVLKMKWGFICNRIALCSSSSNFFSVSMASFSSV